MCRKLKKAICLLSCTFLFAMPFCFMASAETSSFSTNLLTYDEYYIGSSSSGTTISVVFSGSSKVFVLKRTSSATLGFINLVNSTGNSIFKNNTSYPARFSFFLNTFNGKNQTNSSNYLYLTVMFNRKFSAGVNLLGRDSQVSKWEIYYDIPANSSITIDSIQVNCYCNSTPFSTLEFWCKSPTLTYKTDGEFVVDGMHDTIIGNVDPANPPQYSPPAANDAIGNLDALQSQLDNAKKSWNPLLFDLTGLGNAFSGLRLAFNSIIGSFGTDFGIVFKISIVFGCVALLLGLVINVAGYSMEANQRQAREDAKNSERAAQERKRNSYQQYKLNRYRKETYAARYLKEKNAWKRGNK